MNKEIYNSLMKYLNKEIKHCKLRINYHYGWIPKPKQVDELHETLFDLQSIKQFIEHTNRKLFNKRFIDVLFGSDLSPYVDMKKLTNAIVDLVDTARHKFSKKVNE